MVERPPAGSVPDQPGSYQFKDAHGRILYVGKAKSLRSRLSNYFAAPHTLAPRTAQMVAAAATVDWITVRTEVEALLLENELIKRHQPRFNVRLRDDKSYPWLAITAADQWPRAMVLRGTKRAGVRYWGPYGHAYAIRETLDLLLRTFPIRTCSDAKLRRHEALGRPCLLFHIEKCAGPCVGEVTDERYAELVDELCAFLDGDTDDVVARLEEEMASAATDLDFERAARLRDRLASVRKAIERQQVVAERDEDIDLVGIAGDEIEWSVAVLLVRRGRLVGRKAVIVDRVEDLSDDELVDSVLERLYDDPPLGIPREVLVSHPPASTPLLETWLGDERGTKVAIRVPQRGAKRELLGTAVGNAEEEMRRHRMRRASDHNARARALNELQEALGLPEAPLRIECYDMSHLQGTDYVGSMVVLEDGQPRRSAYRRFKVRTVEGNDDVASMEEVLRRRLTAYVEDLARPVEERGRFAYPPQLLLVDGGKGQLGAAVTVLRELGLEEQIPVAALAKRFEEVFLPGAAEPVRIARGSEALFLLQRVRDEAHRFAISYHRQLRGKRMTRSVLDGVPGLGEVRRTRLRKELGGVRAVQAASLDDLRALTWLPDAVAEALFEHLHAPGGTASAPRAED